MRQLFLLCFICFSAITHAQIDSQSRYNSNFRTFYMWNTATKTYDQKDSEYEHSVIDIREINSHSNGYVVISMTDDGKTRMFHGSITQFKNEGVEEVFSLRSKILKSKLAYDRDKKTITYSYEASDERYMKIFVFKLSDD